MNTDQNLEPQTTSDERLLAMLSHLSILFGGLLVPLIIWATQKDKSKFVKFNALQALFYHLSFSVLLMVFIFVMLVIMLASGFGLGIFNQQELGDNSSMPATFVIITIIMYAIIMLGAFVGIGYGIYLAIKAYQGYLKKVPILGNIIYKKVYG